MQTQLNIPYSKQNLVRNFFRKKLFNTKTSHASVKDVEDGTACNK